MNLKRYIFAVVALFTFMFCYESLVHGYLLKNLYLETPGIWRSYDQMMSTMYFNLIIMALLTLWLTFIFTRFYREGGMHNGLRFGFYIGMLCGIQAAGAYYYLPISAMLAGYWFAAYLIESILGGLVIGMVYRR